MSTIDISIRPKELLYLDCNICLTVHGKVYKVSFKSITYYYYKHNLLLLLLLLHALLLLLLLLLIHCHFLADPSL